MAVNLLILICCILFLISAKKYLMPQIFKSGKFMVEDAHAWKDITGFLKDPKNRLKIIITLVLLIISEPGRHILLPGVNLDTLLDFFGNNQDGLWTQSVLKQFSVFVLGVMPFIQANELLLVIAIAVPALRKFSRSRQSSGRLINQLVYLLTIILCIVQGYFVSKGIQSLGVAQGKMFTLTTVLLLTLGTIIMLLLAKGINKFGIGHGISLMIALPWVIELIFNLYLGISFQVSFFDIMVGLLFMITALILCIWIMRVKRVIMVEDVNSGEKIPLLFSLNQSGIFPVMLSSTLLLLPATLASMFENTGSQIFDIIAYVLQYGHPVYSVAYIVLTVSISLIYGILVISPNHMMAILKQNNLKVIDEPQNNKRNILFAIILKLNLIWAGVLIVYFVLLTSIMQRINNIFFHSYFPVIVVAAIFSGCLHTLRIKNKNLAEIYKHAEPVEIMVAKGYLETKGINTVADNDEAYGWIFGFFTGPLAAKRLFVESEDFLKASELMEAYNLKRLVES